MNMTMTPPLRVDQSRCMCRLAKRSESWCAGGGYRSGERLPSEIELSEQLGISRPTLREALRFLEEEGTIVRRHGVGTFVAAAQPVIEGGLEVLESIEHMAARRGLATEMEDLQVGERSIREPEREKLGPAGAEENQVTAVTRVIAADGQRIALLRDIVPLSFLRAREIGEDFGGSVLDLFLQRAIRTSPTRAPSWSPRLPMPSCAPPARPAWRAAAQAGGAALCAGWARSRLLAQPLRAGSLPVFTWSEGSAGHPQIDRHPIIEGDM